MRIYENFIMGIKILFWEQKIYLQNNLKSRKIYENIIMIYKKYYILKTNYNLLRFKKYNKFLLKQDVIPT